MARRKIPFLPGLYYHVYNRGAHRADIFRDDQDYVFLLKRIKDQALELDISVIAYCLMPNHYHLLLRQKGSAQISEFMQAVFGVYSQAFNAMHVHSGTLFEGPFRAVVVEKTEYLLHLCRYIHRNALDAGIVAAPDEWPYSNYLEFVGRRHGLLVDTDFVRCNFGTPLEYQKFVLDYVPPAKTEQALRHYLFGA